MKIVVRQLSHEGDTMVAEVEGREAVQAKIEELLSLPHHFVAINGTILTDTREAMESISAVEESEVIVGKQVAGG